jgi:hypothetical protein
VLGTIDAHRHLLMTTWSRSAVLLVMMMGASCGDLTRIAEDLTRPGSGRGSASPTGPACWAGQLAEVQPRLPGRTAAELCAAVAATTEWTNETRGTDPSFDARDRLVGRWVACGETGLRPQPHAGIEFGANGRWRLLAGDASGALVPAPAPGPTGHYFLLSRDQFQMTDEGVGGAAHFVSWAASMDLARFEDTAGGARGIYARTRPSPLNGRDNVPSITDGTCSMVGTWDLAATEQSPAATFSFDEAGNFVGGPPGADLCAGHTMSGTYRLSPGLFQLTENVGMGRCDWWFDAGYPATFNADCSQLNLVQLHDNCTGGRGYFNGATVLTRRR